LLSQAFTELATRPAAAVDAVRGTVTDVSKVAAGVGGRVAGMVSAALAVARPPASSPLNVPIGEQRRFATVDLSLADLKRVRAHLGGTINDTILAVIAGALRTWLQTRGLGVAQGDIIRAMLPISIAVPTAASGHAGGNRVSATLVELPVGEADPAVRLQQISYQLAQLEEGSQFVGADAIVNIAGFGPPTLHALGARVGSTMSSRVYNLVITNVPGPQRPLYAAGSRMLAAYPCVPLTRNQALSMGLISYDGGVYVGLYADRDALPDLDVLVSCLHESAEELITRCEQHVRTLRVVKGTPRKKAAGSS
jgi:WS/DGAT/MGAT family acyltransferase